MFRKSVLSVHFIFILILCMNVTCLLGVNQQENEQKKIEAWKDALRINPLPNNIKKIKLNFLFSFPKEDEIEQDVYFKNPSSMVFGSSNDIYISDSRRNMIFRFDLSGKLLQKIGRKGQGPGEFNNLYQIWFKNDSLIADDRGNKRIQYFTKDGLYIKSFKLFRPFIDAEISEDFQIIGAPILITKESNLIDIISGDGKLIKSFGFGLKHGLGLINSVDLSLVNNRDIFVAFNLFPIIKRYNMNGELINEFRIKHKMMGKTEKINIKRVKMQFRGKRVGFFPIINALQVYNNYLYILHSSPRIEILELTKDGNMKTVYWHNGNYDYYVDDFLIKQSVDQDLMFYFTIRNSVDVKIYVFGTKNNGIKY